MSTATAFADSGLVGRDLDENTVITDYWLSFVSVRHQDSMPDGSEVRKECEFKLDELCRHLSVIAQGRLILDNGLQSSRPTLSAQASVQPRGDCPGAPSTPAGRGKRLPVRSRILEAVRSSFLYATIQKLF